LTEAQQRALILARTRGQVANADLRDATGLDTLAASQELRQLRDRGLLLQEGAGSATSYVCHPEAEGKEAARRRDALTQGSLFTGEFPPDSKQITGEFPPDTKQPGSDTGEFGADTGELPEDLQVELSRLGPRTRKTKLRDLIERICALGPQSRVSLARLLRRRSPRWLAEKHLGPMVREGRLRLTHPDRPNHPRQAYVATRRPEDAS